MLRQVCFPKNKRKLALFVCACWRKVWHLLSPSVQERLPIVEAGSDTVLGERSYHVWGHTLGEIDLEMCEAVWDSNTGQLRTDWTTQTAQLAAVLLPGGNTLNFWDWGPMEAESERVAGHCAASGEEVAKSWSNFRRYQCDLFRDIYGVLERPIALDPDWLAWDSGTVVKVAQAIYEERAFDRLPILSDALEEAGCTNADILAHCRQPGEHVRGCWGVDLILGKE
jgi:hypothetical protein